MKNGTPLKFPVPSVFPTLESEFPWQHGSLIESQVHFESPASLIFLEAFERPLSLEEHIFVQSSLADSIVWESCGGSAFVLLVHQNPQLAGAVLGVAPFESQELFIGTLCETELNVQGMECLSIALKRAPLPCHCVTRLLACWIQRVTFIEEEGRQARTVKLLCAVIQEVLDSCCQAILPLVDEIEAFCVTFARLAAGSRLYRRLQEIQGAPT